MPLIPKPNYNQIFASQAPEQDKPAVFNNYPEGWGPESRPNNGKPTIKGFNYLQQTSDLKDLWILQNGACLPYDESIEYAEGAPVLKDGVIQYKTADGFSPAISDKPYILKYFTEGTLYPLNARIMLENGDIVKSTINGNASDPNVDMTGWASEVYKAIGNTGYLYVSKLKGDGTDETDAFQQELNQVANLNAALGGGVNYKCNRKGTVLISHVVMPSVTGMIIDFTGTVFKVPDGTNVLDKDVLRFNSIKKSYVFNLSMDGNSANLPDDTSGLGQWIGRCIMFRLGNNSEDCIFFNTKVVNSLYCASQWGNNISNITFQNIEFDNVGEHVFYTSGSGGGLNTHVFFKGFDGGSWGTNPNAALNNHECAVIKSSQTIGFNDDFAIEDSEFNQTSLTPYAAVIMNNADLLRCRIKNIKVAGNIKAIIYPGRSAHFCDIDGVYNLSGADNIRLVYSLPSNTEIKRYTARNIHLPAGNQVHMQVFDKLSDATLLDFTTSNPTTPVFSDSKSCVFEDIRFLGKFSILNIQHDIDFIRTKFLNNSVVAGQSLIDSMGLTTWVDGKYVTFNECEFSNTSGYSWDTQNNNARVRIKGGRGIMRSPFNRAGTTMKYLDIDGVTMPYSGSPLANVSPVFSTLRGLIGYDGTQKRNFLKWTGQVTVSSGSNTGSVNLSSAIARPILAQDVYVVAPNLPTGTSYIVGVDSNLVTITLSANATSALQFLLKVDVSD